VRPGLNINGSVDNKQDDVWNAFTPGNSGLAYETVRSVQIDAAGNVWFGLNIGGVSVLTPQGGWATFSQADGLVYDSITALTFSPAGRAVDRHRWRWRQRSGQPRHPARQG
jgi:ligand-binding sensor domain-containing protein